MRLTLTLILFAALAATAGSTYSQSTRINLKMKDVSLVEVFREIERTSEFGFFFKSEEMDMDRRVSIDLKNASIEEILKKILIDNYEYRILDKNIVVTRGNFSTTKVQQGKSVMGKVTDSSGISLPGVSVVVKGTTYGTITDGNGNYSLTHVPENAVMQFSFIGMKGQEVTVGTRTSVNITLENETFGVDEVVVVGYGIQKRSDVTGSVASVSRERLESIPNNNIAQALEGSISGLQITTTAAGAEGNSVEMLVRGRKSIAANNSPLIIWDGIPFTGDISGINPNDVGSIEVLKDASASAIYGSRGSNGVILITSKKGKKGKVTIAYDGSFGIQDIVNKPDLLNAQEFYDFKMTRLNASNIVSDREKSILDSGAAVDWYDLATQQGQRSQHSLSVTGGSDKISFYVGTSYIDVEGVTLNDRYKSYSLRPNIEVDITPWLTMTSNSQLSFQDRDGLPIEFEDTRHTGGGANFFNPLSSPYNSDGTLAIYANPDLTQSRNPLSNILVNNTDGSYRIFSANSVKVDLSFVKGLSYKLNTGTEIQFNSSKTYWGRNVALGLESNGTATTSYSLHRNFTIENILNYSREFGKHSVSLTALYSSQSVDYERDELTGSGFPTDVLTNYQMASATVLTPGSSNTKQNLLSQMGRLNYSYKSKYLLTVTTRRDGFSAFGEGRKYGIFPSVAMGWNISKEKFMHNLAFISDLKLRTSYGLNGNQSISPYRSLATLGMETFVSGSTVLTGYVPSRLANEELGWESTKSFSVGLDFRLLKNKIQGNIDYYNAQTYDLLLNRSISPIHGFTSILQNMGKTANQGVELGISTTNISSKSFNWTTNFNISHNQNKIVDLYGDKKDDVGNNWFIGKPINVIYGLQYDGIFRSQEEVDNSLQPTAQPGYVRIKDADGDKTISASNDRTIIGYSDPKFIWGITNTLRFKSLSLMIFLHGVQGVTKANPFEQDNVSVETRSNTTKKDWWSTSNPNGTHFSNDGNANQLNIQIYEDASFTRLKDLTLAYDLPGKLLSKLNVSKLKLYFTARNLATFTQYGGLDPELSNQLAIPLQREFVFGINLGL